MSKSRVRKRRQRRRSYHARRTREQVVDLSVEEFEQLLTDRDRRLLSEAMNAEQSGDLGQALRCLRRTPRPTENLWERQLVEMVELGDGAETCQWARFTMAAATRWVRVLSLPLVARIQRDVAAAAHGVEGSPFPQYPGWVVGRSAVGTAVAQTLLFDELMLEVFLVQCAPILAARAGGGRSWAESPGRVYELLGVRGIELRLRDRTDEQEQTVRHCGEAVGLASGDLVYGHLIDVPSGLGNGADGPQENPDGPGRLFALPPIVVDELGARRLRTTTLEDWWDFEARCATLGAAVRSGNPYVRSPIRFDDEPAPGIRELMDGGLDRIEAEQLAVVELAVITHEISSEATPVMAYHAGVALAHQRVFAEALRRYTDPAHEPGWRELANASHGCERQRFLQLADACRAATATSRPPHPQPERMVKHG